MKTGSMGDRFRQGMTLGILVMLIALTGCSKTQQVLVREPAAPAQTLEGRWDLRSFGPVGSETTVPTENPVFIIFSADGKITGSGGCNRYFGGWGHLEGTEDAVRIWHTGSTRMACPEPIMTREYRFLEELSRVSKYRIEGKELRLFYNEGRGVMLFSMGTPP